jgi:hypothetical protein
MSSSKEKAAEIAKKAGLGKFDTDIYGAEEEERSKYMSSLPMSTEEAEIEGERELRAAAGSRYASYPLPTRVSPPPPLVSVLISSECVALGSTKAASYGPSKGAFDEAKGPEVDPFAEHRASRVSDRDDEYHARRLDRVISPVRADPFAEGAAVDPKARTYSEIMREQRLDQEKAEVLKQLEEQKKQELEEKLKAAKRKAEEATQAASASASSSSAMEDEQPAKKRGRSVAAGG